MKILIVDDNANDRKLLKYIVERKGHEAVEARDGLEGLKMAKAHIPALIISDAIMPLMDGFQFLRAVKEDETIRSIPFIFYSAIYRGDRDVDLATALGAEAYIIKPKEPAELWEEVEIILQLMQKEKTITAELIEEDEEYLKRYSQVVAAKLEEKVRELKESLSLRTQAEQELNRLNVEMEQHRNRMEAEMSQCTADLREANRLLEEERAGRKRAEEELDKFKNENTGNV